MFQPVADATGSCRRSAIFALVLVLSEAVLVLEKVVPNASPQLSPKSEDGTRCIGPREREAPYSR